MRNKIAILTASLLIASNVTVFASSVNDKKDQIRENQEALQDLKKDRLELSDNKKQLNSELQKIVEQFTAVSREVEALRTAIAQKESEIRAREDAINQMNASISRLEGEIEIKIAEIAAKEAELAEKQAILDSRVRTSYMNSSVSNMLYTLLHSESLADFTDRLVMIRKVVDMDKEVIQQVNAIKEALTVNKADLEVAKNELTASRTVVEAEKAVLVEDKVRLDQENQVYTAKLADISMLEASKQAAIDALSMEEKEVAAEIGDILEENAELENEIKALIRAESGKNASQLSSASSGAGYIKPVAGRVSSSFGYRIHPILKYRKLHTGIDFAASSGTSIRATRGGTVIRASYNSSYGNHVIIDHGNGITTLYAHMSRMNTSYGARVAQGQVIGYVGSTGMSTGPHLHLEFRKNGSLVNPAPYLGL